MTGRHLSDLFSGRTGGSLLMPWARIDDAFDDHPKVLAVLEHEQGGAAIGLWTLCLTWAHRNTLKRGKVPGLVPASLPRRYLGRDARELAAVLVKEELWEAFDESAQGWQIHDFDQYLPADTTRAARSAAGRKGAASRWGKSKPDSKEPGTDGNLLSEDGNLPEPGHDADGNAEANDGSRAPARRAISNEIAPDTRVPSPEGQKQTAAQKRRRATRIPDDFTVDAAMVAWARERVPQVDGRTETEKFINHWTSASGQSATKLDWVLTWKNWMLTAAERTGKPSAASPPLPGVSPRDEHRYRR